MSEAIHKPLPEPLAEEVETFFEWRERPIIISTKSQREVWLDAHAFDDAIQQQRIEWLKDLKASQAAVNDTARAYAPQGGHYERL